MAMLAPKRFAASSARAIRPAVGELQFVAAAEADQAVAAVITRSEEEGGRVGIRLRDVNGNRRELIQSHDGFCAESPILCHPWTTKNGEAQELSRASVIIQNEPMTERLDTHISFVEKVRKNANLSDIHSRSLRRRQQCFVPIQTGTSEELRLFCRMPGVYSPPQRAFHSGPARTGDRFGFRPNRLRPEYGNANGTRPNGSNFTPSRGLQGQALDAKTESDAMAAEHNAQSPSYSIPAETLEEMTSMRTQGSPSYWSHVLYRGPEQQSVVVHYCTKKADVERVAGMFADDNVLGFDLEWRSTLRRRTMYADTIDTLAPVEKGKQARDAKERVSLIQIASEKRIGLFHIALHPEESIDELIGPTLRKILDNPNILKVGVAIAADSTRLKNTLGVECKPVLELSNLHKLVTYGRSEPEKVNRRLVALARQVEEHLGFPLFKGEDVRSSDWSQRLNFKQTNYAATDAYAALHLFNVLEAKRKQLNLGNAPARPWEVERSKSQATFSLMDDLDRLDFDEQKPATDEYTRQAGQAQDTDPASLMDDLDRMDLDREEPSTRWDPQQAGQTTDSSTVSLPSDLDHIGSSQEEPVSDLEPQQASQSLDSNEDAAADSSAELTEPHEASLQAPEAMDPTIVPSSESWEPEDMSSTPEQDPSTSSLPEGAAVKFWKKNKLSSSFAQPVELPSPPAIEPPATEQPHWKKDGFSPGFAHADEQVPSPGTEQPEAFDVQGGELFSYVPPPPDVYNRPEERHPFWLPSPSEPSPVLGQDLAGSVFITAEDRETSIQQAETWIAEFRAELAHDGQQPKTSQGSLRAYALWHCQGKDLAHTAALLRDPPLKLATASSYVLEAVRLEQLPYDKERIRVVLDILPKAITRIVYPGIWSSVQQPGELMKI